MKTNQQRTGKSVREKEKNLRKRNELLKLKLSAEMGADFYMPETIDPGMEHAFLQNIIEFEKTCVNAKRIKIHDLIGKPAYEKHEALKEKELVLELIRINELLSKHGICVDFLAEYPAREKYRFITEELFFHEADNISIPGMIQQFIYEYFHPNHPMDITNRTIEFINGWFKQDISEFNLELSDQWITDQGIIYTPKDVIKKFSDIWSNFLRFENTTFKLLNVHADVTEGEDSGMGYSEGIVQYDAVLENGESIHFEGPFKFYLQLNSGWWNVFFVYWPGLDW